MMNNDIVGKYVISTNSTGFIEAVGHTSDHDPEPCVLVFYPDGTSCFRPVRLLRVVSREEALAAAVASTKYDDMPVADLRRAFPKRSQ